MPERNTRKKVLLNRLKETSPEVYNKYSWNNASEKDIQRYIDAVKEAGPKTKTTSKTGVFGSTKTMQEPVSAYIERVTKIATTPKQKPALQKPSGQAVDIVTPTKPETVLPTQSQEQQPGKLPITQPRGGTSGDAAYIAKLSKIMTPEAMVEGGHVHPKNSAFLAHQAAVAAKGGEATGNQPQLSNIPSVAGLNITEERLPVYGSTADPIVASNGEGLASALASTTKQPSEHELAMNRANSYWSTNYERNDKTPNAAYYDANDGSGTVRFNPTNLDYDVAKQFGLAYEYAK